MPTYEYACTACDEQIEVVQRFADAPLTDCPSCSGRLRKVYSPVGVVFKGSGFYKTDSRSSSRVSAKPDGGGKSDGSNSDGNKSDGGTSETKADSTAQAAKPAAEPSKAVAS